MFVIKADVFEIVESSNGISPKDFEFEAFYSFSINLQVFCILTRLKINVH